MSNGKSVIKGLVTLLKPVYTLSKINITQTFDATALVFLFPIDRISFFHGPYSDIFYWARKPVRIAETI